MVENLKLPDEALLAERRKARPWRELSFYTLALMEMSWVALWYRVLIAGGVEVPYWRAYLVLSFMTLSMYFSAWIADWLNLMMKIRRWIFGALILANLLLGLKNLLYTGEKSSLFALVLRPISAFADRQSIIPPEFFIMILSLLVCFYGLRLVGRQIEPGAVGDSFRLGITLLLIYGLFIPDFNPDIAPTMFTFLFFGMTAMASARLAIQGQLRGGQAIPFDRRWLLGLLGSIFLVVGAAVFTVDWMSDRGFLFLSDLLGWTVYLLALLFSPLIWAVIQAVYWLGEHIRLENFLASLERLIAQFSEVVAMLTQGVTDLLGFSREGGPQRFLGWWLAIKPYVLWGALILFIVLTVLAVRRFVRRDEAEDEQDAEAVSGQGDLLAMLRNTLRNRLAKMMQDLEGALRLNRARRYLAAARIRRIYAQLMDLSAGLGKPRPASWTPLEFLPRLEETFPALNADLEAITTAYLSVRYGELPETVEEVDAVEHAWKRVSAAGQEQLRAARRAKRGAGLAAGKDQRG
ncbi:MAG: DUF4129 domain-containing protein [Chloroflexi bacterium]|nr:DUF4129 domain-containing protein [Chloroflexota bacterium]